MSKSQIAEQEIKTNVDRILLAHPSGEAFFEALDNYIKIAATDVVYEALAEMAGAGSHKFLVMSGGFGKVLADRIDNGQFTKCEYVLFEGGIRKGDEPKIIRTTVSTNDTKPAVFVDDTIYGGLTFRVIQEYLKKHSTNIQLDDVVVVYDGRPEKLIHVNSIFRYYDFFEAVPNFKF